jgi:dihydrofolate reductase
MRKVILAVGISLDFYIARPDGSVDFLFAPRDFSMATFFKSVDTAIMGRKTLEAGLRLGKTDTIATPGITSYVFSRSLPAGERNGATVVKSSPKSFVGSLRTRKGKNIWHMGGGELARQFLKDDLIDEIHLGVVPVLIGKGIPLFPGGFPERKFALIENKTYSRGLIELKYSRVRTKVKAKA